MRLCPRLPQGLPPYLVEPVRRSPCTDLEETHLFRKMNYLKHQANLIPLEASTRPGKTADLDEIDRLAGGGPAVKNQIIRSNLRLVVSIAKRHVGPTNNFFELVSDGNMSPDPGRRKLRLLPGLQVQHVRLLGDHEELRPDDSRGKLPSRPVRHRPRRDVRGRRRLIGPTTTSMRLALEAHAGGSQGHARPPGRPRAARSSSAASAWGRAASRRCEQLG